MDTENSQKNLKDKLASGTKGLSFRPSHEAIFMSVSKKAEKISMALYMVTDLVKVDDPIRQRIRQCSVDLITETRQMSYAFSGDIYFIVARTIHKSWELVSLIEVSASIGFISDMNAKILREVLIEFIGSLRDKQKRESFSDVDDLKIGESLSDQINLSKSLFEVKEDDVKENPKGHLLKDKVSTPENPPNTPEKTEKKTQNKVIIKKEISGKKSNRQEEIVSVIKEKGEVAVADIAGLFPDISTKTIQRELSALVDSNILKKEGEKRWSRYSVS